MDKYSHSIITSSFKYVQNLQYLAKEDNQTNIDLFDLNIINQVYQWACWFETTEEEKLHIQKLMSNVLNRNRNLTITNNTPFKYYKNVSLPQTLWTWQRVYDNLDVKTVNTL